MVTKKLLDLLDSAVQLAGEFSGGYSNRFFSAEEFHAALQQAVADLKQGNYSVIDDLWIYFAPTCSWDDFVGKEGMNLGNEIFEMIDVIRKQLIILRN